MRPRTFKRPDHSTVVAYLALFLVLATGAAYAAATIGSGDVINGSLKSADLKNNAGVKGVDVRNNNLTGSDFGGGNAASIGGADVGDNALGGGQLNEGSLAASRVVARLGGIVGQPVPNAGPALVPFLNNTYTQAAGEPNEFVGGGQVTFPVGCTQPRSATVYLLLDSPLLTADQLLGLASVGDNGAGTVSRRFSFAPLSGAGYPMALTSPAAAAPRTLFLQADANCNAGSGVTLDTAIVDVVGHR